MNIESKAYRVKSALGGQVEVSKKASAQIAFVERSSLPSVHELAAMSERQFDKICAEAIGGADHV